MSQVAPNGRPLDTRRSASLPLAFTAILQMTLIRIQGLSLRSLNCSKAEETYSTLAAIQTEQMEQRLFVISMTFHQGILMISCVPADQGLSVVPHNKPT